MRKSWERGWFGLVTCALLGVLPGCGGAEHPPYVDDTSTARGGSSGRPNVSQPDGELGQPDGSSSSTAGKGGGGDPTPGSGKFDPDEVYFATILWCGSCSAADPHKYLASNVSSPDDYVYGFWDEWPGQLRGSDLVYLHDNQVVEFVPDVIEPQSGSPKANDEVVDELDCGTEPVGFFEVTRGGRMLYTCGEQYEVWYEDGKQIYEGDYRIREFVTDDLALAVRLDVANPEADYSLLRLSTGEATPLVDLPQGIEGWVATRGVGDGFHLVIQLKYNEPCELWNVNADGSAEKLGTYPLLPENVNRCAALAVDDTCFTSDEVDDASRILRATIGASDFEVFYSFGPKSDRSVRRFFTGR
jgi:hypothetical protein